VDFEFNFHVSKEMPIPLLYQRQKKQEILFDLLKRQGAATSLM
jgi:hypothetical protein